MASNEKDQKLLEGKIADVEVGTEADLDEVMKKYDRESNTRVWEGIPGKSTTCQPSAPRRAPDFFSIVTPGQLPIC